MVVLSSVAVLLYVLPLGRSDLYNKGEPREALVVWDIVHSGSWLLPMRNQELPSKPPMFHWTAAAIASVLGGVTPLTARLPSALYALGGVLLTFLFGAKLRSQGAAFFAALVLATSFRYAKLATQARVDMTTAFFVTAAVMLFYLLLQKAEGRRRSLEVMGFFLLSSLAVLSKGPLGILLPLLTVGIYSLLQRNTGPIRLLFDWRGITVFLCVAGGWYAVALAGWGDRFFEKQIVSENLAALLGREGPGHRHGFFYYIPELFLGTIPWSVLLPVMAVWWIRKRSRPIDSGDLYLISWFLAVIGFFTLGSQKRADYLLPLFPVVALWLGEFLWSITKHDRKFRPLRAATLTVLASALVAGVLILALPKEGSINALMGESLLRSSAKDRAALLSIRDFLEAQWGTVLLLFCLSFVPWAQSVGAMAARKSATALFSLFLGNFLFLGILFPLGNDLVGETRSFRSFAAEVRSHVRRSEELFYYKGLDYSMIFYLQRPIPRLDQELEAFSRERQAYILLTAPEWDALPLHVQHRFVELARSQAVGADGDRPVVLVRSLGVHMGPQ